MFAPDVLFGTENEKMGLVVGKVAHRLEQNLKAPGSGSLMDMRAVGGSVAMPLTAFTRQVGHRRRFRGGRGVRSRRGVAQRGSRGPTVT
jgi:hypothetical protein